MNYALQMRLMKGDSEAELQDLAIRMEMAPIAYRMEVSLDY